MLKPSHVRSGQGKVSSCQVRSCENVVRSIQVRSVQFRQSHILLGKVKFMSG